MTKLMRINQEFKRKNINIVVGIRQSNLQLDYRSAHPSGKTEYKVAKVGSVYPVSYELESKTGEVVLIMYQLEKNHISFNHELCEVKCFDCPKVPICAHTFICNCPTYSHRNFCHHSHIVAMSQSVSAPNTDHQYISSSDGSPGTLLISQDHDEMVSWSELKYVPYF